MEGPKCKRPKNSKTMEQRQQVQDARAAAMAAAHSPSLLSLPLFISFSLSHHVSFPLSLSPRFLSRSPCRCKSSPATAVAPSQRPGCSSSLFSAYFSLTPLLSLFLSPLAFPSLPLTLLFHRGLAVVAGFISCRAQPLGCSFFPSPSYSLSPLSFPFSLPFSRYVTAFRRRHYFAHGPALCCRVSLLALSETSSLSHYPLLHLSLSRLLSPSLFCVSLSRPSPASLSPLKWEQKWEKVGFSPSPSPSLRQNEEGKIG